MRYCICEWVFGSIKHHGQNGNRIMLSMSSSVTSLTTVLSGGREIESPNTWLLRHCKPRDHWLTKRPSIHKGCTCFHWFRRFSVHFQYSQSIFLLCSSSIDTWTLIWPCDEWADDDSLVYHTSSDRSAERVNEKSVWHLRIIMSHVRYISIVIWMFVALTSLFIRLSLLQFMRND